MRKGLALVAVSMLGAVTCNGPDAGATDTPHGFLDSVESCAAIGRAADTPDRPIQVQFYVDGKPSGSILGDESLQGGAGATNHRFIWRIPAPYRTGRHTIRAFGIHSAGQDTSIQELTGSPKAFRCDGNVEDAPSPAAAVDPTRLPLGDQKYVTDAPRKGYVFVCDERMFQQRGGPGAHGRGDWLNEAAGTYDKTKKLSLQGNVLFPNAQFYAATTDDKRVIAGNGLPVEVPAGIFPVSRRDPGYQYDRNPNQITPQHILFAIPRYPVVSEQGPRCIYKEVGITLDGVPLHGPLNSIGNDELAHELQDACTGGPQPGGGYHRHGLSDCTPGIHERVALVGYALDGFGIFSPYDENGKELTTADLDECHGITSPVMWEGKRVTMYHYVLTRDYPYTIGCFKGTPTRNAFPPLPGAPPQFK